MAYNPGFPFNDPPTSNSINSLAPQRPIGQPIGQPQQQLNFGLNEPFQRPNPIGTGAIGSERRNMRQVHFAHFRKFQNLTFFLDAGFT